MGLDPQVNSLNETIPTVFESGGQVRTCSRDVAAAFDKEHRNVLQAIDNLIVEAPELGGAEFSAGVYELPNTGSQQHRQYEMTRDGFALLAMGFTGAKALKFKMSYIDAFNRMEAALRERNDAMRALNDPVAMRGLLLNYSEKVLELQAANAELAPKAEALDRISTADGSLNITEAAKALQMRPKDLFSYLKEHGWIYKRPNASNWLGYQPKASSGLLEHKVTTVLRADGSEKITEQVRVTPKGLTKLAALIQPFSIAA